MKSFKIALKDINELFSSRFKRIAVIVITLMPLLYSFLYLYAFWDPYSKLDKMPVAIVQMDKGSIKDGQNVNYGRDVIERLKDNHKVKWEFVDYNGAKKGLEEKEYYSMIIIPEDFSRKITDSSEGKIDKASIEYIPNEKKNFLAAQVSSRIVLELKDEIAKSIGEESSRVVIDNLYEVRDGLKEAFDGSRKLNNGSLELRDGSKELMDNMKIASDGSRLLNGGLINAANGQQQLVSGIDKLIGGIKKFGMALSGTDERIPQLVKGSGDLAAGTHRLEDGLKEFHAQLTNTDTKGLNDLVSGSDQLSKEINNARLGAEALDYNLSVKLNAASSGISQAADGVSLANKNLSEFINSDGFKALSDGDKAKILEAAGAVKMVSDKDIKSNIAEPLKNSANAARPLAEGLGRLSAGGARVAGGMETLAVELADKQIKAEAGMNQLIMGAEKAREGAVLVAGGTEALANGIADKQLQAGSGISQLLTGAQTARDGANTIALGLGTAADKSGELSVGLGKLHEGSGRLNDGLNRLTEGTLELSNGLSDGYNKITDKLRFKSEDMSKFMSEPVKLQEQPINHVPDYGTGFAPYFIPLSLWVGALIMFFIISSEVDERYRGSAISAIMGKFMVYAFVGALQAAASSFILLNILHLGVKNTALFYGFNILMSWVFIAIIQCMISLFGDAGRFLSLALLMLQLTSCGGTFPMELVPNFFNYINPYLPMTYTVSALREIISGIDYGVLGRDIVVLTGFMMAFMLISIILKSRMEKITGKINKEKELKVA